MRQPASEVVAEQGGDPVERRSAERLPKQQGVRFIRRPWRVGEGAKGSAAHRTPLRLRAVC
jgi:hypothetical protein